MSYTKQLMTFVGIQDPKEGDWTLNLRDWNINFNSLNCVFTELEIFAIVTLYEIYMGASKEPGQDLFAHHMFSKFRGEFPLYKGSDKKQNIAYITGAQHAVSHGCNTVLFSENEHVYPALNLMNCNSIDQISLSNFELFLSPNNIDFLRNYEQIKVDTFCFLFLILILTIYLTFSDCFFFFFFLPHFIRPSLLRREM